MAAFGFSINTLTLCGLILAIGLVVDDAIIVVENVEKFLERGEQPLQAVRAAMAEITAPIVTITLVLAAVFVPVAFIPGLTGRLYNQFAMTIVFSFVFSAINSLTFSPAMSRLFLRPRHGESKFFFFRWFNHGMRWLENSYDAFLEFTAHHWWTIVMPSIGLLALTYVMLIERPRRSSRPKTGLPDRRDPDARRHRQGGDLADRQEVGKIAHGPGGGQRRRCCARRLQRPELDQPDQLGRRPSSSSRNGRSDDKPELRANALARKLQEIAVRQDQRRGRPGAAAAADPRPEPDRRVRVHDRRPRGQGRRGAGPGHRPVPRRGRKVENDGRTSRARPMFTAVLGPGAPAPVRPRPHQGRAARRRASPTSSPCSRRIWAASTSTTSTSTARSGRSSSRPRGIVAPSPATSPGSTCSTARRTRSP